MTHRATTVRAGLTFAAVALTAVVSGCDGDGAPKTAPSATAGDVTSARTSAASPETLATAPAGTVEVTGLVGAVDVPGGTIAINRLSGADVGRVQIVGTTRILSTSGGRLALAELRPSERLIARGSIDAATGDLVAESVTVQPAGPGAPPGG